MDLGLRGPALKKGEVVMVEGVSVLIMPTFWLVIPATTSPPFRLNGNSVPWDKQLRMYSQAWFVSVIVKFHIFYVFIFFDRHSRCGPKIQLHNPIKKS